MASIAAVTEDQPAPAMVADTTAATPVASVCDSDNSLSPRMAVKKRKSTRRLWSRIWNVRFRSQRTLSTSCFSSLSSFSSATPHEDKVAAAVAASQRQQESRRKNSFSVPTFVEIGAVHEHADEDEHEYDDLSDWEEENSGDIVAEVEIDADSSSSMQSGSQPQQQLTPEKCYEVALDYLAGAYLEEALEHADKGLALVQETDFGADSESNSLFDGALDQLCCWRLRQIRAQVLGRLGKYEESLKVYQLLAERAKRDSSLDAVREETAPTDGPLFSAVDLTNFLYACGRMCVYLKSYEQAIEYYRQELSTTSSLLRQACNSHKAKPLACPTCVLLCQAHTHLEMARLFKQALTDNQTALRHYQLALRAEANVHKQQLLQRSASTSRGCAEIATTLARCATSRCRNPNDTVKLIRETKRAIGRIHFEQGDIDMAMGSIPV